MCVSCVCVCVCVCRVQCVRGDGCRARCDGRDSLLHTWNHGHPLTCVPEGKFDMHARPAHGTVESRPSRRDAHTSTRQPTPHEHTWTCATSALPARRASVLMTGGARAELNVFWSVIVLKLYRAMTRFSCMCALGSACTLSFRITLRPPPCSRLRLRTGTPLPLRPPTYLCMCRVSVCASRPRWRSIGRASSATVRIRPRDPVDPTPCRPVGLLSTTERTARLHDVASSSERACSLQAKFLATSMCASVRFATAAHTEPRKSSVHARAQSAPGQRTRRST